MFLKSKLEMYIKQSQTVYSYIIKFSIESYIHRYTQMQTHTHPSITNRCAYVIMCHLSEICHRNHAKGLEITSVLNVKIVS